jgi:hypothetical protein
MNLPRISVLAMTFMAALAAGQVLAGPVVGAQSQMQTQPMPLDSYQSFRSPNPAISWRAANEQAARLGGFVGVMRESPRLPAAPAHLPMSRPAASVTELVPRLERAAPIGSLFSGEATPEGRR